MQKNVNIARSRIDTIAHFLYIHINTITHTLLFGLPVNGSRRLLDDTFKAIKDPYAIRYDQMTVFSRFSDSTINPYQDYTMFRILIFIFVQTLTYVSPTQIRWKWRSLIANKVVLMIIKKCSLFNCGLSLF